MNNIQILSHLFNRYFGRPPLCFNALPGAGGNRRYYRMKAGDAVCLGVVSDNRNDSDAFCALSDLFIQNNISVPIVYDRDLRNDCYLVEDFGDTSLFSLIKESDESQAGDMVRESIDGLIAMQNVDRASLESCLRHRPFGRRQAMWDLNYFKYDFLKPAGVEFDEEALEDDFELLASRLTGRGGEEYGFMYRDFQSRNIMVSDGKPRFIDFQGGRLGPGIYDVVSLLWQAKAGFSKHFRSEMTNYYIDEKCRASGLSDDVRESMAAMVPDFVLFRTLQVLGAYGFRGLVEKRQHFIESIPLAIANLSETVSVLAGSYPELERISRQLDGMPRFRPAADEGLTVTVFSFSYKKGYPEDLSGNGGGFMFDCRAMHNPGRYSEYRALTGRDRPVIDFLRSRGEADVFVEKALSIVSPSVERYRSRGFTSLQIGFGCTGGQHRSVYCAEAVARALAGSFPDIRVNLIHREQGIEERPVGRAQDQEYL